MADDRNFRLKVITPERVFYEGDVHMVEFNTTEGEIGIYKGHVPMTVIVSPGILTISENSQTKNAALHAGFVEILQDKVTDLFASAGYICCKYSKSLVAVSSSW